MGSEPVSASYVMLQLSIFKNEIVESIRNEMKTVFREEIDKLRTKLRTEMDQKISDLKVEQQEFTNKKIDEMERAHLQREEELSKRIDTWQDRYEIMTRKYEDQLSRIVEAEDRQRRLNIVVSNLKVDSELSCIENTEKFFKEKLKIPQEKIDTFIYRNAHYLGKEQSGKGRSLICAFVRQTDRYFVMSQGKNLQGTDISLRPNYSPETRAKKDEMLILKKTLQEQGMKMRVTERNYKPVLQILGDNNRWSQYEEEY